MVLSACSRSCHKVEPCVIYNIEKRDIVRVPCAFEPLSSEEFASEWGKELYAASQFAREMDFYRAITSYKKALMFMPKNESLRCAECEFGIIQCYYFACKYYDALEAFEESTLLYATKDFPAYRELLIIMHDCYDRTCQFDKAEKIVEIINKNEAKLANDLQLSIAIREGDLYSAQSMAQLDPARDEPVKTFIQQYCHCKKSIQRAQNLNAILPGAGYYYVGQKRAAVTSFVLNTLFIAATYHFFHERNWGAGAITLSLETGWYFGGINGAGLAAKEYNEHLYNTLSRGMLTRNDLFPVLMLETAF